MKYFEFKDYLFHYDEHCNLGYIENCFKGAKSLKQTFKKLISDESLEQWEMYNLLINFYDFNRELAYQEERDRVKQVYPNMVEIRTEYFGYHRYKDGAGQVALVLRVKNGVKIKTLKTYTVTETEILLDSGDVKFISSSTYGKLKRVTEQWNDSEHSLLSIEFGQPKITKEEYERMLENNPEIHTAVFADIDMEQIHRDYENVFLPEYKRYLKDLAEKAILLKASKIREMKKLEEEKASIEETISTTEKLKIQISDATKGR